MDYYTLGDDKKGTYVKNHHDATWKGARKRHFPDVHTALEYLNDIHTLGAYQFALKWQEARNLPRDLREKLRKGETTWEQLQEQATKLESEA